MFEKVNPSHPDKIADRIAGAIVDLAYTKEENPKVAVEVLIGHNECNIITESSVDFTEEEIKKIVDRISGINCKLNLNLNKQDVYLAENQRKEIRCGDNGIFKGVPLTEEEKELSRIARIIYNGCKCDGKYILANDKLIICQSNIDTDCMKEYYKEWFDKYDVAVNPLGDWTGGINVDSGATNRKLGSDMAQSVTGGGLCLSGDSEFLSDDLKWHKISNYKKGQKVAEWDNGNLHFINPIKYVHNKNDEFIHIYNDTKLSMKLTPYHQVLLKTSKGNLIKHNAYEVAEKINQGKGNYGSIIHNFKYDREIKNSDYADETEYKLQVAFCADGTILNNQNQWNGRIRVKKESKKKRLRELLAGKQYKETQDGEYSIFWYKFTKKNKSLRDCFANENWDILKDEIFLWDGDKNRKLFKTTKKDEADFIQLVLSSYGVVATISQNSNIGKIHKVNDKEYTGTSIEYIVHLLKSTTTGIRENKGSRINVDYCDNADSYCFEVPTHNLIIRHNDRIFITGNCGKDLSKADVSVNIYAFLKAQETGKPVELFCAIGDNNIDGKPYNEIVEIARNYIKEKGGFEKFAEWGLV